MSVKLVDVVKLKVNEWNPNSMDEKEFIRLKNELDTVGSNVRAPITVVKDGERYKVVDGEHRFKACKDLGFQKVYVFIGKFDEKEQRMQTIKMNRLVGEHDVLKEGAMIKGLVEDHGMTMEQLEERLGYSSKEMESFETMNEFDMSLFETLQEETIDTSSLDTKENDNFELMEFELSAKQQSLVETAIGKTKLPKEQAIALIAQYYVEMQGTAPEVVANEVNLDNVEF